MNLTELGLTDRQARIISDLSRSLNMSEADFCKTTLLETVDILLADPARIGEIVKDTLKKRHPTLLVGMGRA